MMLRRIAIYLALLGSLCQMCLSSTQGAESQATNIGVTDQSVQVTRNHVPAWRYWLQKPADSTCTSPSACYFHPLTSPSGVVLTDIAPDDHLHHRGVFLAWLEVKQAQGLEGDFWGWGKFATLPGRQIINQKVEQVNASNNQASFQAENHWKADGEVLLRERLHATIQFEPSVTVHTLRYRFSSEKLVTLGQHAFSGFTVRTRKDATITAYDPAGAVALPAPSHVKPESDWPDRPWYAFELVFKDGKKVGVAVINHPENPPTLWHNVTKIGMLNPCIVAPAPVQFTEERPLHLNYQMISFDGAVPSALLNQLAEQFSRTESAY